MVFFLADSVIRLQLRQQAEYKNDLEAQGRPSPLRP